MLERSYCAKRIILCYKKEIQIKVDPPPLTRTGRRRQFYCYTYMVLLGRVAVFRAPPPSLILNLVAVAFFFRRGL